MSEMGGDNEAVSVLAPLLRSSDPPCPLTFLGAGPSFRSGVPTAADAVTQIARVGRVFNASTITVLGYHHSERSILNGLISQAKKGRLDFSECHLLVPATWRKTGIPSWYDVKRDADLRLRSYLQVLTLP